MMGLDEQASKGSNEDNLLLVLVLPLLTYTRKMLGKEYEPAREIRMCFFEFPRPVSFRYSEVKAKES